MRKKPFFLLILFISIFAIFTPLFSALEEKVQVGLIEIWVKVTDKHNQPVTDLAENDFQIYIDGKKMPTQCFENVFQLPSDPDQFAETSPVPSQQKRKFILYFDMLNTKPGEMDFLKAKMIDFLKNTFTENDEGMVFVLLPTMHLGVVQRMTSNKEELIDVVNKVRGNPSLEARLRDNERRILDVLYPPINTGVSTNPIDTGIAASARAPELGRQARAMAGTFAAEELNQNRFTTNSFLQIATYLAANQYEGRLVMVYVSGGFPLFPGSNYFEIVNNALEFETTTGTDLAFREHPDYDFQRQLRDTIATLNRLNVTIYSVDAGGLVENNRGAERNSRQMTQGYNTVTYGKQLQDSLVMIAKETGGVAFVNSQNFEKGLSQIAEDMSQQYWLCSSLPPSKNEGKYHKIEVKVDRVDLSVRHRRGYLD